MAFGQNVVEIVIRAKDEFSKAFSNAQISMKKFRTAAVVTGAAGAVIATGFVKSIQKGIELESAMVGVAKTTGLTGDKLSALQDDFIDLSKVMPVSAASLATIGEVAGQLGISGADDIRAFTETVAKMSIATELTEEGAALALAKISNAMGIPISSAENLGSAINELSNISAASAGEIVNAMSRVAGSASTLGLTTETVAGLSAALIATGEPAERAGTKLRSAFDSIVTKMEDEVIPLMGKEFPDALRNNADKAILDLITTISKIEDPIERQQRAIDIFGTVGASAINKLSNNIPEMNRLIDESTKAFEKGTSLQEEYDIAAESTENQIQLMKNQFSALQIELAGAFIPILKNVLIPIMKRVADFISNLSDPAKQFIIILGLVTVAVAILAVGIAVLSVVSLPWLLIIAAIIAAITIIIFLILNWKKAIVALAQVFLKGAEIMDKGIQLMKSGFIIAFNVMKNIAISVWNFIIDHIAKKVQKAIDFINMLISAANRLPKVNISLIPDVDFSSVRGQLTDIGTLRSELSLGREARASQFKEAGKTFIINIENAVGLDAEDLSKSLSEELSNKVSL